MSLENAFGALALEATQDNRYAGGKVAVTATVTSLGDNTVYTPTSGMAVRLYWVSAINDPASTSSPVITIKLGSTELYRTFAIAHWEVFTGAVDAPLIVRLSEDADVAFTAHIQEV